MTINFPFHKASVELVKQITYSSLDASLDYFNNKYVAALRENKLDDAKELSVYMDACELIKEGITFTYKLLDRNVDDFYNQLGANYDDFGQ